MWRVLEGLDTPAWMQEQNDYSYRRPCDIYS